MHITLAVEGRVDEAVARRLLKDAGLEAGPVYGLKGKPALDPKLEGYNRAARFGPWLVLRDLNSDAPCAPALRQQLLPSPSARMRLHVVVHAVEAWLLADTAAFSTFLGVKEATLPPAPEVLPSPKQYVINLARGSRKRTVRDALLPEKGAAARVGPGYNAMLAEFVATTWRPPVAALRSESLERLRRHLDQQAR